MSAMIRIEALARKQALAIHVSLYPALIPPRNWPHLQTAVVMAHMVTCCLVHMTALWLSLG